MRYLLPQVVAVCTALLAGGDASALDIRSASVSNAGSSLTLLYQNNLNASDDWRHASAILLDPMPLSAAAAACGALGESLLPEVTMQNHQADFYYSLSYLQYSGTCNASQKYHIANATVSLGSQPTQLQFGPINNTTLARLPVLCTQSQFQNGPGNANSTAGQVTVAAGGNMYQGFRNLKSFRFQGIPYTNSPARWEYSTVYNATGQTIDAGQYGAVCPQAYDSSSNETCLFLNIQTPHIPKQGTTSGLKPVLFSIHGGGFENGNGGLTSGEDGGNLASRHDIVSVEINYRLNTLGFLAIPGTDIRGNFGIGDQITALQWVKANIAAFGGDPDRVTIIGDSAGAGSVRALLGSPPVIKESLIAGGVAQSNLGGGNSLGLDGNYGTPYSTYFTIEESYWRAGQDIFQANGCNQAALDEQIACLRKIPALTLASQPITAQYIVQDGTIIVNEHLIVETGNASTAHVPVIFGICANDGASIGSTYPHAAFTTEAQGIAAALGISEDYASAAVASGLFPKPNTGNFSLDTFNVSQRISTDITFRCIDEATVYAGAHTGAFERAYYYEYERTYEGYDPNGLGLALSRGPVEPGFPNGDPNVPYFHLHTSDLGFTYGNQYPLRDEDDLRAVQLVSGYFAQFTKTGDPNADPAYLRARGYADELAATVASGPWEAIQNATGPAKALSDVSRTIEFPDLAQCAWLNYTIEYYLNGGS